MFDVKQLLGLARSMQGVAMDVDDQDDAATCALAAGWMQSAAREIEHLQSARNRVLEDLDLMLSDDPMVRQNTAKVIRANLE